MDVQHTEHELRIRRAPGEPPLLVQHARPDTRPFIHPILAPDGRGALTEDAPPHHPWQHGLYVGLNDVNGVGFWTEGFLPANAATDGTFHPQPLHPPTQGERGVEWAVETEWRSPAGEPMIAEAQRWTFRDGGDRLTLELDWTLRALTDLTFGEYAYGGLFLRMPYREEAGGSAQNSEGQSASEAEGRRARWVAVTMPVEGRDGPAGIAMMDHPGNPEYPVPWRVDGQLGIGPSRCIAGAWTLPEGEAARFRHRVFVYAGEAPVGEIEASWSEFSRL